MLRIQIEKYFTIYAAIAGMRIASRATRASARIALPFQLPATHACGSGQVAATGGPAMGAAERCLRVCIWGWDETSEQISGHLAEIYRVGPVGYR